MNNPVDKKSVFDNEVFTYRITKDKKVFISYHGKQVVILSSNKALNFIEEIKNSDDFNAQLIMAKATGNFKRGNEKLANQKRRLH